MSKKPNSPRGRGQPPFAPSEKQRRQVEIWKGGGMSDDAISHALGISRNTLVKHFASELETGWSRRRSEVVEAMFKAAKKGNVTAQKAYLGLGDPVPEKPARSSMPKPGKKKRLNFGAFEGY